MEQSSLVCVRNIKGKGRGVFARRLIKKGTLIERVPILLVPTDHLIGGEHSPILSKFFFMWNKNHVAISLGYGSLYNHSYSPNAHYEHGRMSMIYSAIKEISKGAEITINYNGDSEDQTPMWFEVV